MQCVDGTPSISPRLRLIAATFWILAFASIPGWISIDRPGWDVSVYRNAIQSVQAGHDPYSDAMAVQDAFHRDLASHASDPTPFSYVYSPITLPLLRPIGAVPVWLSGTVYWFLYAVCALCLVWVGMQAVEDSEYKVFLLLAPAALFFPGLLQHDVILSGNVAIILYALVLLGAAFGWWRGQWHWCYLAILIASCYKAPLLILVVIPLLSARRQWLPAGIAVAAGLCSVRHTASCLAIPFSSLPASRQPTVQLQPRLWMQPRGPAEQVSLQSWHLIHRRRNRHLSAVCCPRICCTASSVAPVSGG